MKILKDLHTGRKKFSRVERMHFLQELEEELKVYYLSYTETVDRPYSEQEQEIIAVSYTHLTLPTILLV